MPFIRTVVSGELCVTRRAKRHTPIADTQSLLRARVKHRTDDHEPRGDRAFAHAKNETDSEETAKILACCMRAQSYAPNEDVDAVGVM